MDQHLRQILELGQPAHAAEAARLIERLAADPSDAQAVASAEALIEAYLHDPYLTRHPS